MRKDNDLKQGLDFQFEKFPKNFQKENLIKIRLDYLNNN